MAGVAHSATSSISSTVLGKRDIGAASESEKEETKEDEEGTSELQQPPKKRRIAPTLISDGSSSVSVTKDDSKDKSDPTV
jgi:chromatin assembly factor 1 subunit B